MKKISYVIVIVLFFIGWGESIAAIAARITQVEVQITGEGADDPQLQALIAHFPLKKGQRLDPVLYNQAKQVLFTTAEQQGYLAAELLTHTIEVNRKQGTARIIFHFATGSRFFFGSVYFSSTPLREKLLQRYVPFQINDPYSPDKLVALQDALNSSNYFQQVTINPLQQQIKQQQVPIQVILVPRKSQQSNVGIGYGTDTGPRLGIGNEWRYLNSYGHRLTTLLRISSIQKSFQTLYTIPGKNPAVDWYNLSASIFQDILPQSTSITKKLGAAAIKGNGYWQRTVSLNYQLENFRFTDQPAKSSNLLIPGVSWVYTRADDLIYTKNGQRFSFRVQGATDQVFSTTSFVQTEVQDKFIFSPTETSRVILRGNLGYTAVHDLERFPASLRFYAGGSQSIRGYSYQKLGPGRYLIVGSAEYQHQIVGNWNGAVFYDVGNAFDHFSEPLRQGVGIGIVWRSPVGPMSLTLARGLERPPGRTLMLQFTMGPDLG